MLPRIPNKSDQLYGGDQSIFGQFRLSAAAKCCTWSECASYAWNYLRRVSPPAAKFAYCSIYSSHDSRIYISIILKYVHKSLWNSLCTPSFSEVIKAKGNRNFHFSNIIISQRKIIKPIKMLVNIPGYILTMDIFAQKSEQSELAKRPSKVPKRYDILREPLREGIKKIRKKCGF